METLQKSRSITHAPTSLDAWAEFCFDVDQCPIQMALISYPFLRGLRITDPEPLVPRTSVEARPNSLSRQIGRGYQPPHTDGAHLTNPPAYVMLWALEASPDQAGTHIRKFDFELLDDGFFENIRGSVWSVKTRSDSYHYSKFWHPKNQIRWDSACFKRCANGGMSPWEVDEGLAKLPAKRISWDARTALIINNKTVLHGRENASGGENNNRKLFRVYWYEQ